MKGEKKTHRKTHCFPAAACQGANPEKKTCHLSIRKNKIPAEIIAEMLQYNGNQENLEREGRQVVVQEKCLLHQEEGQVIHSPASNTDLPS